MIHLNQGSERGGAFGTFGRKRVMHADFLVGKTKEKMAEDVRTRCVWENNIKIC
jgi:hypothetical protein